MAGKFYAVRNGKNTGIFTTWEECRALVHGFPGAEYKSFKTRQEALAYMGGAETVKKPVKKRTNGKMADTGAHVDANDEKTSGVEAYVDGSYNSETNEFSYGMIVLFDGQESTFSEKYNDKELAAMHNVAGEIKGAEAAMKYAIEHALDGITIYHDYEGIAKWCLGEWKTNKDGTKAYKAYYDSIKDKVAIKFVKVTGHSNNKYNDVADELAKQALGIR